MSWLPPPPETRARGVRPWRPPSIGDIETDRLTYVVVDEIVDNSVGLSVSEWPQVDEQGRVRFLDPAPARLVAAAADALSAFLAEHRKVAGERVEGLSENQRRELVERPVRIGDAFAVRVDRKALETLEEVSNSDKGPFRLKDEHLANPQSWMEPPVHDISGEAREAAKASFYGAVAPVLDPTVDADVVALARNPE